MPSRNLVLFTYIAACVSAAAETPVADPRQAVTGTARTYIPDSLAVPQFTPPAPAVPKELPQIRIDSSVTVPSENVATTITLQRGEPSTVPDLPPPAKPAPSPPPRELTAAELAERKWKRQHTLNLGATVYDHKTSQIHWTDQETGKDYQAWCGFDVSLLAGLGRFVHKGETYQFMLMNSFLDTEKFNKITNKDLAIPSISAGQILVTQGNAADTAATAPIRVIQEVISSEKERLLVYQSAREKYQQESAAWQKAHPPVPRNETFILRPHRGSRYLDGQQTEQKGSAR